jgi:hypothetical protein
MQIWKVMLGLGAACAACCALPLLGIAGGLAASASALWACAGELAPVAIALGAVAVAVLGTWAWLRRRAARSSACGCSPSPKGIEDAKT